MSREQLLAEILSLPITERRSLLDAAIESLPPADDPDMTPEFERELDRRLEHYKEHPESASTWEEASARIRGKIRQA